MTSTELVPASGTEVEHYDAGTAAISRAVEQMTGAHKLAQALADTAFVPQHFRGKPDDVAAAIMYGAAIGMDPMASLRSIFVIGGQPGMYAKQMVALVQAAGHRVWTEESTDEAVTVCGQRRGSDKVERDTWTYARADKAGYTSNKKYQTDPQSMLYARAAATICRRVAADALAGLDTSVEELHVMEGEVVSTSTTRESAADVLTPQQTGDADPANAPNGITDAQHRKLGVLFREAEITDGDAARRYCADVIGREISSRKEMTKHEAGQVIDALEEEARSTDQVTGEVVREPAEDPA